MKSTILFLLCLFILPFALPPAFGQAYPPALKITPLTGNFYIFTTYQQMGKDTIPSNSMYLVTTAGVVLFDTPWDSTQNQPLLDSIYARHHQKVVLCIVTHFHEDRTGGLAFLRKQGVATYSSELTYSLCIQHHMPLAENVFTGDTLFRVGNDSFQTYYPGEGHTKDNIVIWFPKDRILYGGCLVKSVAWDDLGFIGDANLIEWPRSVEKVIRQFPHPAFVIPGHADWTDNQSLYHTLKLLEQHRKKAHI